MEKLLKEFAEYLDDKIRVLSDILKFNKDQEDILKKAEHNAEEIEATMDEKDRLSEILIGLNDRFDQLFTQLSEKLPAVKDQFPTQLQLIREKNVQVTELEQKVQDSEKKNRQLLDRFMGQERMAIKQSRQGSKAAYGYYQNMSGANLGQSHLWDSKQ